MLEDPNAKARLAAAYVLDSLAAKWPALRKEAYAALESIRNDPDPEIRELVEEILDPGAN